MTDTQEAMREPAIKQFETLYGLGAWLDMDNEREAFLSGMNYTAAQSAEKIEYYKSANEELLEESRTQREKMARLEAEKAMIQKVADDRFAIMQLEAERLAAAELSNRQLRETASAFLNVVKEYLQADGGCDHSVGICMCAEYRLIDKAEQLLSSKPSEEVIEQDEGYPGIAHDFETTKLSLVTAQADNTMLRQWILQHGEHKQSCEVFNTDDAGYHYDCTCGFERLLTQPISTEALDAHVAEFARNTLNENVRLRKALQFYADGSHFVRFSPDAWDTCSGEPSNFLFDESDTAQVEDGYVAKQALSLPPAPEKG